MVKSKIKSTLSPFDSFRENLPKRIKKSGLCYSELVTLRKLWKIANNIQKDKIRGIEKNNRKSVNRILKKSVNRIFTKVPQEAKKGVGTQISVSYGEKSTKKGDLTHKN